MLGVTKIRGALDMNSFLSTKAEGHEYGDKKSDGSRPCFCHESSNNQSGKLTGPPPLALGHEST